MAICSALKGRLGAHKSKRLRNILPSKLVWEPARVNYKIFGKIWSNLLADADVHYINK